MNTTTVWQIWLLFCLLLVLVGQQAFADCDSTQQVKPDGAYIWGSVPTTYHSYYGYKSHTQLPVGSTRVVVYAPSSLDSPVNIYSATGRYMTTLLSGGYVEFVYCSGEQKLNLSMVPEAAKKTGAALYQKVSIVLVPNTTQFYTLAVKNGQFQLGNQREELALLSLAKHRKVNHTIERFTQGICQSNTAYDALVTNDEKKDLADGFRPIVIEAMCKREEAPAKHIHLVVDVEFDFQQYTQLAVSPLSQLRLSRTMQLISSNVQLRRVEVVGFADALGSPNYNKTLSLKRAQTVRDWLVSLGIDSRIIQVTEQNGTSYISKPCQAQEEIHCYVEDRRVEITFSGQI